MLTDPEDRAVQGLDAGVEAVLARLTELEVGGRAKTVGITGPVGGGKSTLAGKLAERIEAIVVTTDRYLPNYDETEKGTEDRPEASDLARLVADLESLALGHETRVPEWSFHEHRRVGEVPLGPIAPDGLVAVEGLHALHGVIRPMLDVAVYVHAPSDVRRARWDAIAERGERGWDVEKSRSFFDSVADPTYAEFADLYRATADFIVVNV